MYEFLTGEMSRQRTLVRLFVGFVSFAAIMLFHFNLSMILGAEPIDVFLKDTGAMSAICGGSEDCSRMVYLLISILIYLTLNFLSVLTIGRKVLSKKYIKLSEIVRSNLKRSSKKVRDEFLAKLRKGAKKGEIKKGFVRRYLPEYYHIFLERRFRLIRRFSLSEEGIFQKLFAPLVYINKMNDDGLYSTPYELFYYQRVFKAIKGKRSFIEMYEPLTEPKKSMVMKAMIELIMALFFFVSAFIFLFLTINNEILGTPILFFVVSLALMFYFFVRFIGTLEEPGKIAAKRKELAERLWHQARFWDGLTRFDPIVRSMVRETEEVLA
jgi:hypothetical protein